MGLFSGSGGFGGSSGFGGFGGGSSSFGGSGSFGNSGGFGKSDKSGDLIKEVLENVLSSPTTGPSTNVVMDDRKYRKQLREILKQDEDSLAGQFFTIIDEGKEELGEILTEGFVEIVIKGNTDYKTSFEIRDEADAIIEAANNRYMQKCLEVNELLSKLNEHIANLYERKANIAERINADFKAHKSFIGEVFAKTYYAPEYQNITPKYNDYTVLSETMLSKTVDFMANQFDRKRRVNEYMEDARDYRVFVSGKIAELNRVEADIHALEMHIEEEQALLNGLESSLDMNRELNYEEIQKQLETMISVYLLDENGEMNKLYMSALERLKYLCRQV